MESKKKQKTENFIKEYTEVIDVLIDFGWIITPTMIGKDFRKVHLLALKIGANHPKTEEEKASCQAEINSLLTNIVFQPLFRAFSLHRAKELKHIAQFSHHLERAVLHYFKNDYFSAVLCMLPAIEGALLSYYGWTYEQGRKPKIKFLIEEIEKGKTTNSHHLLYYKLYAKTLTAFLNRWIFTDSSTADTTLSYLNRHYVLHGMGAKNYYSLADTQRLIMFFDLFIEFLSIEQRINYVFIPHENQYINERYAYYLSLIQYNLKKDKMLLNEEAFMKENKFYYPEPNVPNWNQIVTDETDEFMQFLKSMKRFKKKSWLERLFA